MSSVYSYTRIKFFVDILDKKEISGEEISGEEREQLMKLFKRVEKRFDEIKPRPNFFNMEQLGRMMCYYLSYDHLSDNFSLLHNEQKRDKNYQMFLKTLRDA